MSAPSDAGASRRVRLKLAGRIAPAYAAEHGCAGVIIGGLVARGDFLLLRELLGRIERQVSDILLALNRVFTPSASGKWTPRTLDSLACAPADVLERARRVWSLPESAAIAAAHALIEETLALVEERFPEVDVRRTRARLTARSVDG